MEMKFWKFLFTWVFGRLKLQHVEFSWYLKHYQLRFVQNWRTHASYHWRGGSSKAALNSPTVVLHLQITTWWHLLLMVSQWASFISGWWCVSHVQRQFEMRRWKDVVKTWAASNRAAFLFNIAGRSDRERGIDYVCCWQVPPWGELIINWSRIGWASVDSSLLLVLVAVSILYKPSFLHFFIPPSFTFSSLSPNLCFSFSHTTHLPPVRKEPHHSLLTHIYNPYFSVWDLFSIVSKCSVFFV